MNSTDNLVTDGEAAITPRASGRWIDHWEPEDAGFWESSGKQTARKNLIFSVFAENIGFSVWVFLAAYAVFAFMTWFLPAYRVCHRAGAEPRVRVRLGGSNRDPVRGPFVRGPLRLGPRTS